MVDMGNYYYVGTLLPDLRIGSRPEITFHDFKTLLKDNLSQSDYDLTRTVRAFYDIENVRALWKGEDLDFRGNYDEVELEEMLLTSVGLPRYVKDFMEKYETKDLRLRYFPAIISEYFNVESKKAKGFFEKFFGI